MINLIHVLSLFTILNSLDLPLLKTKSETVSFFFLQEIEENISTCVQSFSLEQSQHKRIL